MDFSYEVSRSLASCEGALLVVDASQGVEAQTLANAYLAINHGLEIIPVINKIDLPSADILRTQEAIEQAVGLDATDAIPVSAKTGQGVDEVLEAIVHRLPAAQGRSRRAAAGAHLRFVVRRLSRRHRARPRHAGNHAQGPAHPVHVERQSPSRSNRWACSAPSPSRSASSSPAKSASSPPPSRTSPTPSIGDTVTDDAHPAAHALPGFEDIKPMVFAGLYTVDSHEHTLLRDALEKLRLNDSSFFFEPESSVALGFGFRCGFLGLLHMEIIQERLEREYELDLITTAPGVRYHITLTDGNDDRGRQSLALARAAPTSKPSASRSSPPKSSPTKSTSAASSSSSKKSAASRSTSNTSRRRASCSPTSCR